MRRVRVLVEGRFQGLNFRFHTQEQAQKLGLSGFVRNLSDGRIEIDAQGDEASLTQLLAWCQNSPHTTQIKSILFRYDEPDERASGFTVR